MTISMKANWKRIPIVEKTFFRYRIDLIDHFVVMTCGKSLMISSGTSISDNLSTLINPLATVSNSLMNATVRFASNLNEDDENV